MVVFRRVRCSGQEFLIINSNRELFSVDRQLCHSVCCFRANRRRGSISDITLYRRPTAFGASQPTGGYTPLPKAPVRRWNTPCPTTTLPFLLPGTDGEVRIYAAGGSGDLYVLDINTMQHSYLGDIGYGAAGDLTFYQANSSASSTTNQMIDVDLDNPPTARFA